MQIDLIVSALPPSVDGIGDFTAHLARAVAAEAEVRVLTSSGRSFDSISGVTIVPSFMPEKRRSVWRLVDEVCSHEPDWVALQFNQFSFGRWGLNPYLPLAMRAIKRRLPRTRLAVMFHEDFVPKTSWKFRIMRTWQKRQFISLGRTADLVTFSIEPWVEYYRDWFPGRPVVHMPVGSNIPEIGISRRKAREALGLADGTLACVLFGSVHPGRNLPWVSAAVKAAQKIRQDVALIYIGSESQLVRGAIDSVHLIADGSLSADEVSRRVRAADIYLAPYSDGISTRRTSMMTGLQHGIATVSTHGPATGPLLAAQHGQALLLAPANDVEQYAGQVISVVKDENRRNAIGLAGAEFYRRNFGWPVLGKRFLTGLNAAAAALEPLRLSQCGSAGAAPVAAPMGQVMS